MTKQELADTLRAQVDRLISHTTQANILAVIRAMEALEDWELASRETRWTVESSEPRSWGEGPLW